MNLRWIGRIAILLTIFIGFNWVRIVMRKK